MTPVQDRVLAWTEAKLDGRPQGKLSVTRCAAELKLDVPVVAAAVGALVATGRLVQVRSGRSRSGGRTPRARIVALPAHADA